MAHTQKESVDKLNSFLRGEMAAVETYRQAIDALKSSTHLGELSECKRSHESRVTLLADQVRKLGGTPAQSSGPWGAFAKLVEGGAAALGEKAAILALEEGEDHGKRDYNSDTPKLDMESRTLVERQILPEQMRTHANLSALKKQFS